MSNSKYSTNSTPGSHRAKPPTHEEIAALAFSLHQQHGRPPGHDREDWLAAEQILLRAASETARPEATLPAVNTQFIQHPHDRDQRHSPGRAEIRQMNTSRRPASRASRQAS
jgi:hypothetical protein